MTFIQLNYCNHFRIQPIADYGQGVNISLSTNQRREQGVNFSPLHQSETRKPCRGVKFHASTDQ